MYNIDQCRLLQIKTQQYPVYTSSLLRTDLLFQDVYKIHSNNTIYMTAVVTCGIMYMLVF